MANQWPTTESEIRKTLVRVDLKLDRICDCSRRASDRRADLHGERALLRDDLRRMGIDPDARSEG